jgi:hypothetical protein
MILGIEEARDLKSKRIQGFYLLQKAGLNIPYPIKIISHKVFLSYSKNKTFDNVFLEELKKAIREIKEKNPRKKIIGRCGIYVPNMDYIPAPRSSMLFTFEDIINFIKNVYDTALRFDLNRRGSQICVILHPFICPKLNEAGAQVFSSYDKKHNLVLIESIFGNDEGVQSFPHDVFVVDMKKKEIVYKKIPRKTKCMSALTGKWKVVKISKELQEKQTLSDKEIFEIAEESKKMEKIVGPCVLELMYMFGERYYTDFKPYEPKGSLSDFSKPILLSSPLRKPVEGKVIRIKAMEDLKKVKGQQIIFLDREVVARRDLKLILELAEKTKLTKYQEVIIYPGRQTTAHYILALKEAGNIIVFAPDEDLKTGEKVRVTNEEIIKVK